MIAEKEADYQNTIGADVQILLLDGTSMERILEYEIKTLDAGKSIKDFLRQKGYSRQNIVELKKMPESILINGRWEYVNYCLQEGEHLVIHIKEEEGSEKIVPMPLPFSVLYEDEDILVVNKPANMPVHPSLHNYENTLANAVTYYFAKKGQHLCFRCINRLDRDTTGLCILAKHMLSCSILQQEMMQRRICREYLAIADGVIEEETGTVDAPIGRKEGSVMEREIDYAKGERAVTHYRVLERKERATLLLLWLETGRTHQIRVHMASLGHPLIGDFLYHPTDQRMSRQALHAWRISFTHPLTGEEMKWEAPVPEDMKTFWLSQ